MPGEPTPVHPLKALHIAFDLKNPSQMEAALAQGAHIDGVYNSRRIFERCLLEGNEDWAIWALEKGANPFDPYYSKRLGVSVLSLAARRSMSRLVKALLERGAPVTFERHEDTESPVGWAVINKNHDMMALLLDAGADPSVRGIQDETPGDIAVHMLMFDMARRLAEAGGEFGQSTQWFAEALQALKTGNDREFLDSVLPRRPEAFMDLLRKRIKSCPLKFLDEYRQLSPELADVVSARLMRDRAGVEVSGTHARRTATGGPL